MCIQCAATAAAAVGTASGLRAWVGHRFQALLTPRRRRVLTIGLMSLAVLASGVALGGSG